MQAPGGTLVRSGRPRTTPMQVTVRADSDILRGGSLCCREDACGQVSVSVSGIELQEDDRLGIDADPAKVVLSTLAAQAMVSPSLENSLRALKVSLEAQDPAEITHAVAEVREACEAEGSGIFYLTPGG